MSNDRFIRWQHNTLTQFGAVNNLMIGLSVAALGFILGRRGNLNDLSYWVPVAGFAGSAILGVWCAVNRLHDFRTTAQVAKDKTEAEEKRIAREEAAALGAASWRLLYGQIALFGVGAVWALLGLAP